MQLTVAETSDIDAVLLLHRRYHIDSISAADKSDGFVTTQFTREQLHELINSEHGLFIGRNDGEVIAYVMAASWKFWAQWPLFAYMIERLPEATFQSQRLTVANSFQYGPICIDKSIRGSGALEKIFHFAKKQMAPRYPILVTFINQVNTRSFAAHTKKLGLQVIQEFEFNGQRYYELAIGTGA